MTDVDQGTQPNVDTIRAQILPVLTGHRCRHAGLFGSAARGDTHVRQHILAEKVRILKA